MELRDFIVTPIVLIVVYVVAYLVRPLATDSIIKKYFFPALTARIVGAIAVGLIYQFYYGGGDTFNFHTHGSRIIWQAFMDNPMDGLRLFFSEGSLEPGLYKYSSQIWYFRDPQGYFIIRIAAFFDLLTFSSYSATAVLFAVLSFTGAWLMFKVFYGLARDFHRWIAVSCLFIPTVFFWGSGIFKDTITLAALGISLYSFYNLFIIRRYSFSGILLNVFLIIFFLWVIFSIKKYILLSFLPVILFWIFSQRLARIKSFAFKLLIVPFATIPILLLAYYTVKKIGEDDARYNLEKLAETAKITAYDIRYGWGARTGDGSGYELGEMDGTWQSMIKLAPAAINVSLFRPYIWEVRSPLMVLSALESLAFLLITLFVAYKVGLKGFKFLQKPEVIFCLGFSILFAFAVGVSTYNFGTLSRYKIPLLPFYALGIGFMYYYSKKYKNSEMLNFIQDGYENTDSGKKLEKVSGI